MTENTSKDLQEISTIPDPDVRRALRAMHKQFQTQLQQHEQEIQALLEMMLEKHVGSIGEFKRHLTRLQQGGAARSGRIHDQIAAASQPPAR